MTNAVYVFGAGASKDFGLPIGVELFDCALELSRLGDDSVETKELATLLADVDRYMRQIFTNLPKNKLAYPPLEEVLTFLWDCRNSDTYDNKRNKLISIFEHSNGARGVFEIFTKMLSLTLSRAIRVSSTRSRIQVFVDFIKGVVSDRDTAVSFISLNYDVLLDDALFECVNNKIIQDYTYGILLSDVAERYRQVSSQRFRRQTGVLLIKPHGSLNLVYCSHRQAHYGEGFYYSEADPIAATANTLECPGCGGALKPLLVPPLHNKSEYIAASAYKSPRVTWRSTPETYRKFCDPKISEILKQADEITVIGYSLPALRLRFQESIDDKPHEQPETNEVRLRLITKGDGAAVNMLATQFERLVGSVVVAGRDGFYDYLTTGSR
jgi:hypothetical protein